MTPARRLMRLVAFLLPLSLLPCLLAAETGVKKCEKDSECKEGKVPIIGISGCHFLPAFRKDLSVLGPLPTPPRALQIRQGLQPVLRVRGRQGLGRAGHGQRHDLVVLPASTDPLPERQGLPRGPCVPHAQGRQGEGVSGGRVSMQGGRRLRPGEGVQDRQEAQGDQKDLQGQRSKHVFFPSKTG